MVTLPPNFTAIKYPGYFWDVDNKKLYSIKITGELREMKVLKPNRWSHRARLYFPYYVVSYKGHRRYLLVSDLEKLTIKDSEIRVLKRHE